MHISKIVPAVYYTSHNMKRAINFPTSSLSPPPPPISISWHPPPPSQIFCAILKAMTCKNKLLAYILNWKF